MEQFRSKREKLQQTLQLIVLSTIILYFGKPLLIPLMYGCLIAIILYPVCKWLEEHRWPRSLAIACGLLFVTVLFFVLLTILTLQFAAFRKDLPALLTKLTPLAQELQQWIAANLGLSQSWQREFLTNLSRTVSSNAGSILSSTLSATMSTVVSLLLIPVYAALFLFNRNSFVLFLTRLAGERYQMQLKIALPKVISTYFNFIKGMAGVYLVVGILNSLGLLALGIEHAILFGMLTAIMTIIPYVGIILSAMLPISVAIATKDSIWYAGGVVAVFAFVQYLEANLIFPKIVGSQLKLSTWSTLVAIIAGGLIWGVSGMILFLPVISMLKIFTEHMPELELVQILLRRNEDMPESALTVSDENRQVQDTHQQV